MYHLNRPPYSGRPPFARDRGLFRSMMTRGFTVPAEDHQNARWRDRAPITSVAGMNKLH